MNMNPTVWRSGKPNLRELCMGNMQWDVARLADASGVAPGCVFAVLTCGMDTDEDTARRILVGLNALAGTSYTLADILLRGQRR